MPKNQTTKVRARIPEILKGIKEGRTIGEIAREHNVTRRAIQWNMVSPEFQALLKQNMDELMTEHFDQIAELRSSDDPENQREASRERGRMIRALMPKVHLEQSESYNVDMTTVELQRVIDSLPYEKRREALARFLSGNGAESPRKIEVEATIVEQG